MAAPKIADKVAVDRARIVRGVTKRDLQSPKWKQNLQYFLGDQFENISLGEHDNELVINKVFPMVRSQAPALFFQSPHFRVYETRSGLDHTEVDAKEHLLNSVYQAANGYFAGRMSVLATFFAFGAIKAGYTPEFHTNSKAGKFATDPTTGQLIIDSTDALGRVIPQLESGDYMRGPSGEILFGSDGMPILEPPDVLVKEDFFVRWVPWWRMVFDPEGSNDFRTHRWVAEEWIRPLKDIKDDPLLKNTSSLEPSEFVCDSEEEIKRARPLGVDQEASGQMQSESVTEDEGRVRGWTVYDFVDRRVRILSDSGQSQQKIDFFLRDDPMPMEMLYQGPKCGGPYSFLMFNEVPGSWYPLPDIEPLKPLQDEMNIQRSKISTHMKRADRKYIHVSDFISDQEEWDKLTGGGDMAFAEVGDLAGVRALEMAPMDPAIMSALPNTNIDFDEIAGAAEMRGVARAETATQGAILENRQQIRESDRQHIIRLHLVDVGSILLRSCQANMTFPMYAKVADSRRGHAFKYVGEVLPAEIQGDFDINIDVGTMMPKNDAIYRQQALSFMQQILVPLMSNPVGMAFLSSKAFLEELFEVYEIANTEIADEISKIAATMVQAQQQQQQAEAAGMTGLPGMNGQSPMGGIPVPLGSRTQ